MRWMPDGAISSAWGTTVYDSAGRETFHGFGELTFYENGTVSVPWSVLLRGAARYGVFCLKSCLQRL